MPDTIPAPIARCPHAVGGTWPHLEWDATMRTYAPIACPSPIADAPEYQHADAMAGGGCGTCLDDGAFAERLGAPYIDPDHAPEYDAESTRVVDDGEPYCTCGHALAILPS